VPTTREREDPAALLWALCPLPFATADNKSLVTLTKFYKDLLKGPETDPLAVTALLSQLLRGEDATTILTN
jgi:hypothetical protein